MPKSLTSGLLKSLSMFIIISGMISRVFFVDKLTCNSPKWDFLIVLLPPSWQYYSCLVFCGSAVTWLVLFEDGVVGFILGPRWMILGFVHRELNCDQPDEWPSFIKVLHFMYVAAFLFWISALTIVIVSLHSSIGTRTNQNNHSVGVNAEKEAKKTKNSWRWRSS